MRRERSVVAWMGVGVGLLCAAELNGGVPLVLWNATASAPVGLYVVAPFLGPSPGGFAVVRPSPELASWLSYRGYLPPRTPLVKRVAAGPGMEICRYGSRILVGGRDVARARFLDGRGRPLPEWAGCRRLRRDEIFLLNAAPDSLDGRYFGPTGLAQVVGPAWPVFGGWRP